ncbi:hypothetical protein [Actinomadura sp. HBU206391]|uniref:hypothetical protein n=1 Tax=Actinomadura sp. HBU206391 TaxID=2731692 RepID=UPI00164F4CC2|nr:hypothetical protein [Actinomadura sp. HBU206391]MBC6457775.1 hypothetical protein [Actinomadura sp. HBU206391]
MLERFREYPPDVRDLLGFRYCTACAAGEQKFLLEGDEPFTAPLVAAALARRGLRVLSVRAGDGVMDWQAEVSEEPQVGPYVVWCPYGRPDRVYSLVIMGGAGERERPLTGFNSERRRWGRTWWTREHGWISSCLSITLDQAERWARVLGTSLPSPAELGTGPARDDDEPEVLRCKEYLPEHRDLAGARYWAICDLPLDEFALIQADEPLTEELVGGRLRALGLEPTTIEWSARRWRASLAAPVPHRGLRHYVRRGKRDRSDEIYALCPAVGHDRLYFSRRSGRWERWSGLVPGAGRAPHALDDMNDDESEILLVSREQAERVAWAKGIELPDDDELIALAGGFGTGEVASPALTRCRELGPSLQAVLGARYCTTVRTVVPSWRRGEEAVDLPALLFGDRPFTAARVADALTAMGVVVETVRPCDRPPGEWWAHVTEDPRCWDEGFDAVCRGGEYDRVGFVERRLTDPDVHLGWDSALNGWGPLLWTTGLTPDWWARGDEEEHRLLVTREQAERLALALGTPLPADEEWDGLARTATTAVGGLRCREYSPALREAYGVRYWSLCRLARDSGSELSVLLLSDRPLDAAGADEGVREAGVEAAGLTWHRDHEVAEWRGRLVTAPEPDVFHHHAQGLGPSGHVREIVVSKGSVKIWYDPSLRRWNRGALKGAADGPMVGRRTAERLARPSGRPLPGEAELAELTSTFSP